METKEAVANDENGKLLDRIYYGHGNPGSFSSEKRLYDEAKKENPKITRKIVKDYMKRQYVVSRHKRLKKS